MVQSQEIYSNFFFWTSLHYLFADFLNNREKTKATHLQKTRPLSFAKNYAIKKRCQSAKYNVLRLTIAL